MTFTPKKNSYNSTQDLQKGTFPGTLAGQQSDMESTYTTEKTGNKQEIWTSSTTDKKSLYITTSLSSKT